MGGGGGGGGVDSTIFINLAILLDNVHLFIYVMQCLWCKLMKHIIAITFLNMQ